MSAVSLGVLASELISAAGMCKGIVDYVLIDVEATSIMVACHTYPLEDFNTSDMWKELHHLKHESDGLREDFCYTRES